MPASSIDFVSLEQRVKEAADPVAVALGTEPKVPAEYGYTWDAEPVRELLDLLESPTPPLPGRVDEWSWGHRHYFHHFAEDGEHRGSVYIYWNPETGERVIQRVFGVDFGDDYELPQGDLSWEGALLIKEAAIRAGITPESLRDELGERG